MPETRIAFADSNWLVAAYHQTRHTAVVRAWGQRGPSTIVVSSAVLAECRAVASHAGLKVFPELRAEDRAWLKKFRGS